MLDVLRRKADVTRLVLFVIGGDVLEGQICHLLQDLCRLLFLLITISCSTSAAAAVGGILASSFSSFLIKPMSNE